MQSSARFASGSARGTAVRRQQVLRPWCAYPSITMHGRFIQKLQALVDSSPAESNPPAPCPDNPSSITQRAPLGSPKSHHQSRITRHASLIEAVAAGAGGAVQQMLV